MSLKELQKICAERKIKYYRYMNIVTMRRVLSENIKDPFFKELPEINELARG